MNAVLSILFVAIGSITGFLTLALIARLVTALFSDTSRGLIKKRPIWHLAWGLAAITSWVLLVSELPILVQNQRVKAQVLAMRSKVLKSVAAAGGWDVLRSEGKMAAETITKNPFYWQDEKSAELTNSFPLVSLLNPRWIEFKKSATNEGYVILELLYSQWSGGRHATRYYQLVLTPTNSDELPKSLVREGDKILKLTNSVYEVTWHF